jgi:uncharacterized membrane protein
MTIHQQVKALVDKGANTEEIYLGLLQKNITVKEIQQALKDIEKPHFDIQSQGITVIILFGAISIGLAAISFIASNWSVFEDIGKVSIISMGLALSYLGAYFASKAKLIRVYNGLLILAQLIFGTGVVLIGEIVNIDIAWQISFLIWSIGVFIAVYWLQSRVLSWGYTLLVIISVLGIPDFFNNYDWYRREYLVYAILALIVSIKLYWYIAKKLKQDDFSQYSFD